jgi:hypothetical protein
MKLLQMKSKKDKISFLQQFLVWFPISLFHHVCMKEPIFFPMQKKSSFFYANTKPNEHGTTMCKEHKGVKNNNVL